MTYEQKVTIINEIINNFIREIDLPKSEMTIPEIVNFICKKYNIKTKPKEKLYERIRVNINRLLEKNNAEAHSVSQRKNLYKKKDIVKILNDNSFIAKMLELSNQENSYGLLDEITNDFNEKEKEYYSSFIPDNIPEPDSNLDYIKVVAPDLDKLPKYDIASEMAQAETERLYGILLEIVMVRVSLELGLDIKVDYRLREAIKNSLIDLPNSTSEQIYKVLSEHFKIQIEIEMLINDINNESMAIPCEYTNEQILSMYRLDNIENYYCE